MLTVISKGPPGPRIREGPNLGSLDLASLLALAVFAGCVGNRRSSVGDGRVELICALCSQPHSSLSWAILPYSSADKKLELCVAGVVTHA